MKILFIGDIVASPGRSMVKKHLPEIRKNHNVDLVVANVENLSHGRGVSEEPLNEMRLAGVDYFTGGDHVFWQRDSEDLIEKFQIVRPANYPNCQTSVGHLLVDCGALGKVLIINLLGRTTFGQNYLDDPFTTLDKILEQYKDEKITASVVDFHAEATSEKLAFGFYVDGRVTAVVGTHTHIPTCDARVLPKKTLYITDIGMTGNIDSVLGVKKEIIIEQFLTGRNQRFDWESAGNKAFRSVLLDTASLTIDRIDF